MAVATETNRAPRSEPRAAQDRRFDLITRNTAEVLTPGDLSRLLAAGQPIKHYIGFEISGKMHLGTGLICMGKVKDFLDAGVECTIFLADWHTWINDKLGGDREVIKGVAAEYFKEGFKASIRCWGGDPSKLQFLLGTDLYEGNDDYWATVIDVSKNTTLSRMQRSITILGRQEGESVDFAKLIYPPMQVADIFIQGVQLAHAGMDQRKAHVIARDTARKLKLRPLLDTRGRKLKPVAIHHPLVMGLGKPPFWPPPEENRQEFLAAMKMSKSDPNSAIFIHDSPDDIRRKIRKAFCPPQEVEFNPILDWAKHFIFRDADVELTIARTPANGGSITYGSFADLAADYESGALHPLDLKDGVAARLTELLEPARQHFDQPGPREMLAEFEALAERG